MEIYHKIKIIFIKYQPKMDYKKCYGKKGIKNEIYRKYK